MIFIRGKLEKVPFLEWEKDEHYMKY